LSPQQYLMLFWLSLTINTSLPLWQTKRLI